jgi:hypothetical protein
MCVCVCVCGSLSGVSVWLCVIIKTDSSLENIKILGYLGFVASFVDNVIYCVVL